MDNQSLDFTDLYKSTPTAQPAAGSVSSSSNLNFTDLYQSPTSAAPATSPSPSSPSTGALDFNDIYGRKPTGHDESDRFTQDDPNANWLEKSWSFLNKPLTESVLGWGQYRQGAGGIERGFERIGSGLTSPLSLLTFAAFAPAGIVEGVAGGLLKEGLTEGAEVLGGEALDGAEAALKVENYAKAVKAAKGAQVAGKSKDAIERAVDAATGGQLPYQQFLNYGKYLRDQGLKESDILSEGLARRIASSGLRKAGVTPGKALAIAKGAETLVNAGFGIQQVHGALYAYPRVMDLLSQGQYDDAAQYMVEAGAGTVFGTLGLAHSIHSVSDIIPGLNERNQLPLSDETEAVNKLAGEREGDLAKASIDIDLRRRQHQITMLELAGVPVPAKLKVGTWSEVGIGDELASAWKQVVASKANGEKLAHAQRFMFHLVDTGGDRVLNHQQSLGLIYAYHLEEWAKDNIPNFKAPERTIENIANEQRDNILYSQTLVGEAKAQVENLTSKITGLQNQLKNATPDEITGLTDQLKAAADERNGINLSLPHLEQEYQESKEWQNPTEETYKGLLDKMHRALNKAADESHGSLEVFNDKVRALGNYPLDIKVLEDEYPQFKTYSSRPFVPQITEDRGITELPPHTIEVEGHPNNPNRKTYWVIDKEGYRLGFGYSPEDARNNALTEINREIPVSENREEDTETPEFKKWFGNSTIKDSQGKPIPLYHGTTTWPEPPAKFVGPEKTLAEIRQVADRHDAPSVINQQAGDVWFAMTKGDSFQKAMGEHASDALAEYLGGKLEGQPHVQYDAFDTTRKDLGTHLGSAEQANMFVTSYGGREGRRPVQFGRILPVYARLENPLRLTDEGLFYKDDIAKQLKDRGILSQEKFDDLSKIGQSKESDIRQRNELLQKAIEDSGHDGVVYLNRNEGIGAKNPSGLENFNRRGATDEEFKKIYPEAHDSYIVFRPEQAKSVFNNGEFGENPKLSENRVYPPPMTEAEKTQLSKEIDRVQKQIESLGDDWTNAAGNEEATVKINKKIAKLSNTLDRLQTSYERGVPGNYLGEVHKLPDGNRVLYLPLDTLKKIQVAMGFRKRILGQHVPASLVTKALTNLETSNPDLYRLIDQAKNDNGDLVISRTGAAHGGPISRKLHTLREELNHRWQGQLNRSYAYGHLSLTESSDLAGQLDKGIVRHLNSLRYDTSSTTRVVEAAAKMMSVKDLSTIGTTPENAAEFLHKYFTVIKNKYGDKAFDNLTHITSFAKKIKQEFVNARPETGPEPTPGPEPTEGTLGGVGGGGGEGPPKGPPEPTEPPDNDWRKQFPPSTINGGQTAAFPIAPWMDGALHQALPTDIISKVEKTRNKTFKPDHIDYVKNTVKILSEIASRELTPAEKAMYQTLRKADDDNWATGYRNSIIKSIVNNHIHHIWGEKDDVGNTVMQHAGSGAFAINASQARHRSWGTAFEGILQGRQLAVHDPVNIIAHDASNIANAAANRKFLLALQQSGLKDIEGMPIGVFFGRGYQVQGEDGTKASILVNPNVVRNIFMEPHEVSRLEKAGLLKSYLKDGRVIDHTPKVDLGNIKEWIGNTDKKLKKLEEQNPLLINPKNRIQHEAGWGQLQEFAKGQAGKIADYLDKTIQDIKNAGPIDGKNYATVDVANKPNDFNMTKYLGQVLHGETRKKITPADLERIQQYADRNRQYSKGLTSRTPATEDTLRKSSETRISHAQETIETLRKKLIGVSTYEETKPINRKIRQIKDAIEKLQNGEPREKEEFNSAIRPSDVSRMILQERNHLDPELSQYLDEVHQTVGGSWQPKGLNKSVMHVAHAAENPQYPQLTRDISDLRQIDKFYNSENPITREEHKQEVTKLLQEINDRQEKKYLWAPKTHIVVDHPSFSGYKWMATASDGTSTLADSDFGISRHYYKYIVNRLGLEPSWLRKPEGLGKITAPILKAGAGAKSILLSGSPFHIIQEVLRGLMLQVNPFVRPNPVANLDESFPTVRGNKPVLRIGAENGLTMFGNRFAAEDYSVGVASHVLPDDSPFKKIPGLAHYLRYSDGVHDLLFNRLVPQLKASGFRKMFDKYAASHPDWSDDAVGRAAAEHTNAAFGGINWRAMGRSAATQDWFHLIALAPDWLESEMRFAAGLFKGVGIGPSKYEPEHGRNFTREQVAGTAVVLWTVSRLVNLLYSGNAHYETPFGLATKDKDGREVEFSVRTIPTDILHMASDPMGFLNGRMSPLLRTEEELRTGRNSYGQKLTEGEKYVDLVSNLVPIWGQAVGKQASGLSTASDVSMGAQLAKAGGATAQIYRTPAQLTAAKLASERSEGGAINPAQIARHRLLIQLEDDLRNQKISKDDLAHMVDYGNLPIADAKAVIKNVQETAGEDPEAARMYSRVSRLDFAGALAVYEDSNAKEKAMLEKLLIKKAKSYVKKSRTDHTPNERAEDPYFKRALKIAPTIETETE